MVSLYVLSQVQQRVKLPVPGPILRMAGRAGDILASITGQGSPINTEGMRYATQWIPVDNTAAQGLGLQFRPSEVTLRDALLSLVASGKLRAKDIGQLAAQA